MYKTKLNTIFDKKNMHLCYGFEIWVWNYYYTTFCYKMKNTPCVYLPKNHIFFTSE